MNTEGLRVEYGKVEGLFRKSGKPKGYGWISAVGSPFGGSDLLWTRSNHGRPKRIGWPGWFAGDGCGGTHGARRRAAAESPEKVFWSYSAPFGPGFGREGPALNA